MMGGFAGVWQWIIVLVIVLILFGGRGKIARLMGDVGKGISSFKHGLKSDAQKDEEPEAESPRPTLKAESVDDVEPTTDQPQAREEATRQRKAAEG